MGIAPPGNAVSKIALPMAIVSRFTQMAKSQYEQMDEQIECYENQRSPCLFSRLSGSFIIVSYSVKI